MKSGLPARESTAWCDGQIGRAYSTHLQTGRAALSVFLSEKESCSEQPDNMFVCLERYRIHQSASPPASALPSPWLRPLPSPVSSCVYIAPTIVLNPNMSMKIVIIETLNLEKPLNGCNTLMRWLSRRIHTEPYHKSVTERLFAFARQQNATYGVHWPAKMARYDWMEEEDFFFFLQMKIKKLTTSLTVNKHLRTKATLVLVNLAGRHLTIMVCKLHTI